MALELAGASPDKRQTQPEPSTSKLQPEYQHPVGLGYDRIVRCRCRLPTLCLLSTTKEHPNKWLFKCAQNVDKRCKYWMWIDELPQPIGPPPPGYQPPAPTELLNSKSPINDPKDPCTTPLAYQQHIVPITPAELSRANQRNLVDMWTPRSKSRTVERPRSPSVDSDIVEIAPIAYKRHRNEIDDDNVEGGSEPRNQPLERAAKRVRVEEDSNEEDSWSDVEIVAGPSNTVNETRGSTPPPTPAPAHVNDVFASEDDHPTETRDHGPDPYRSALNVLSKAPHTIDVLRKKLRESEEARNAAMEEAGILRGQLEAVAASSGNQGGVHAALMAENQRLKEAIKAQSRLLSRCKCNLRKDRS